MLQLASVTRDDVLFDLGSGDGRIVILAARRYGARGVGVEIDRQLVSSSRGPRSATGWPPRDVRQRRRPHRGRVARHRRDAVPHQGGRSPPAPEAPEPAAPWRPGGLALGTTWATGPPSASSASHRATRGRARSTCGGSRDRRCSTVNRFAATVEKGEVPWRPTSCSPSSPTRAGRHSQNPIAARRSIERSKGWAARSSASTRCFGPYDYVNVVQAPDNKTITKISMELGSRGTMEVMTLPAVNF